ncbi:MAG: HTTM domain-containing protein [Lentisphaerales bacterium]|nr:HTTM domain-containing protein [Lentisphaerales bacterium]
MMAINNTLKELLKPVSIWPLIIFRIAFGAITALAALRFWTKGWIDELYLKPEFHFHYSAFHWVNIPGESVLYGLFAAKILLSIFIAAGFFYRISTALFFLTFTYIELLDKALYLNHNYLVAVLAFYLIFVPAHKCFSLDTFLKRCETKTEVADIYLLVIKIQLALVYFFAGIAKLNADWLIHGQPLNIWLKTKTELPLLGSLFEFDSTALVMSWSGMIFDLLIPFLLFHKRTVKWAYAWLVAFHLMTALLFPLGMFPWIMILTTLIFLNLKKTAPTVSTPKLSFSTAHKIVLCMLFLQVILPLRSFLYPGNSLWHEVGFRYSWKVMKVEKTGFVEFICHDPINDHKWLISPKDYLTSLQEMQMCYQPDMILEFAHFLSGKLGPEIKIYADSWVSMNGRIPQRFVKEKVDLVQLTSHEPSHWINKLKE